MTDQLLEPNWSRGRSLLSTGKSGYSVSQKIGVLGYLLLIICIFLQTTNNPHILCQELA